MSAKLAKFQRTRGGSLGCTSTFAMGCHCAKGVPASLSTNTSLAKLLAMAVLSCLHARSLAMAC
eukprot:6611023-Pyramimonas_sp.AAC.1